MEVEITRLNDTGEGIALINGKTTFIPKTIIGDIVDVKIIKEYKNYNYATVIKYLNHNKEKCDIFYNNRIVWIQGVNDSIAKVGFVDNFEEMNVSIKDLYE